MGIFNRLLDRIGHRMAKALVHPVSGYEPYTPSDYDTLWATLQPADILLIEGNQFISSTIKYLFITTLFNLSNK